MHAFILRLFLCHPSALIIFHTPRQHLRTRRRLFSVSHPLPPLFHASMLPPHSTPISTCVAAIKSFQLMDITSALVDFTTLMPPTVATVLLYSTSRIPLHLRQPFIATTCTSVLVSLNLKFVGLGFQCPKLDFSTVTCCSSQFVEFLAPWSDWSVHRVPPFTTKPVRSVLHKLTGV